MVLLKALILASLAACSATADAQSQPARVFELKREPLPTDMVGRPPYSRSPGSFEEIKTLPPGVTAAVARTEKLRMNTDPPASFQIIVAKSAKDGAQWDRLFVDSDGDGRFADSERFDLSRSDGAVQLEPRQQNMLSAYIRPIKLILKSGQKQSDYWISIHLMSFPGNQPYLRYMSHTWAVGKVTLGDTTNLLAVHDLGLTGRFDRCFTLHPREPGSQNVQFHVPSCQLWIDVNGDGHFRLDAYGEMGSENRWLTPLIRRGTAFYELNVAPDGNSIRVTPVSPKVGKLTSPRGFKGGKIFGPEIALRLSDSGEPSEVPMGRYGLFSYTWQEQKSLMVINDGFGGEPFEIKADQTTALKAGPPLEIRTSAELKRPEAKSSNWPWRSEPQPEARLSLEVFDCAGREISLITDTTGSSRPPAPKFKVTDSTGKTVASGTFEYG